MCSTTAAPARIPVFAPTGSVRCSISEKSRSFRQAARGWTCNLSVVGHYASSGGYKVWNYTDRHGHLCGFYDTTLVFPLDALTLNGPPSKGVYVLDMSNPAHPDHGKGAENARRLRQTPDARGRTIDVVEFDTGDAEGIPYLNLYVCNGGVVAPIAGTPDDERALAQIREVYADREVVTVRSEVLFLAGGGGPHCITLQVPAGTFAP